MSHVLLFEDDPLVRMVIAETLDLEGHTTVYGELDASARDQVEREAFDLVLTDIQMPNFNGMDVLRWVRRFHADMPVVAISGATPSRLAKIGCDPSRFTAFLHKPFSVPELLETIETATAPRPS